MDEMSHQHMSNIYHFITSIVPTYSVHVTNYIWAWLSERFDGEILEYHPDPNFKEEREFLKVRWYLQPNLDIIVNDKKIGSYEELSGS